MVLKIASLADTGVKIATAKNDQEKTVILIDSVASNGGSAAAVALTAFLVGTPTGWLAIAGMVVVGVAGGMVVEAIGDYVQREMLFDENGNRQQVLIDQIW